MAFLLLGGFAAKRVQGAVRESAAFPGANISLQPSREGADESNCPGSAW